MNMCNKWRLLATATVAVLGVLAPTASAASPATGTFRCKAANGSGWSAVSAGANTYIVGNCADGWIIHRTWVSGAIQNGPYTGGQIYGAYNGCGAVQTRNVGRRENSIRWSACSSSARRNPYDFLTRVDCRSDRPENCTWDPDLSGHRGTRVLLPCRAYANVRPFGMRSVAANPVQSIAPGRRVYWRYITRDRAFVMVHDYEHGPTQPSWVFVPAGCVTTPNEVRPN